MLVESIALVLVVIVLVVLFNSFSTENDKTSPGLMFLIMGFGGFVGLTCFLLALTYFQKSEDMLKFLLAFATLILFPISLSSAAATFVSVRTLKETIAAA
jgi:FtsH-binding integral membrane protein